MGHQDGVGQLKPSRSEGGSILSKEEQEKYARQVQEFLKATTPVRALKPSRSENLDDNEVLKQVLTAPQDACEAELKRFKELEAAGVVLNCPSFRSLLRALLGFVFSECKYDNNVADRIAGLETLHVLVCAHS